MRFGHFTVWILVLCIVLMGCAGPAAPESEEGKTAEEQPAPEAPSTEEAEPLTMLVFLPDDVERYAAAFTEQTRVEIEFGEPSNAAFEQMLTDFAAGRCTYDVVAVDNALGSLYTMDSLLDQGYFLPLTDAQNVEEAVEAMLPVLQELVTREDMVYALPYFVRFKLLEFNAELYDAVETDQLAQYNRRAITPVTETLMSQLPPQGEFASWEELVESGYLDERSGDLAYNTLLEQYILDAGNEGFAFDSPEFVRALELMKAAKTADGKVPSNALGLHIGGVAIFNETEEGITCNSYYPLPTLDGKGRIPMAYGVLAVNTFTDQPEDALRFLDVTADIVLNGTEEGDVYTYGMPETAACFADEAHLTVSAGLDPENRARWQAMQANLVPITDAGFLTSFHLEIFPQYLDGAITAEQCAAMTQERYRMYKLEQGE
jgi:ABC-type glycerol-3-phosphate transport system substrate-binding protein